MDYLNKFDVISITVHSRIAIGLSNVARMKNFFSDDPEISDALNKCLELGWQWMKEKNTTAGELYELIPGFYAIERKVKSVEIKKKALFSIMFAYYLLVCWSDYFDYIRFQEDRNNLPSDISDVTDQYLIDSLKSALEATHNQEDEIKWQQMAINKAISSYPAKNETDFGAPITNGFFD